MAEQPSPLKSKKSSSRCHTRNDSDKKWLLIPNNLELGRREKPSKKLVNKKPKLLQQSSSTDYIDGISSNQRSIFQPFSHDKQNKASAAWIDYNMDPDIEEHFKRRISASEEDYSDSDYQHFPANDVFPEINNLEQQTVSPQIVGENENVKSVKDELKKKQNQNAVVNEILRIQEYISEAESSWQKLNFSDEPNIKEAFVKLKNAVKDVEGGRENKHTLHHSVAENAYGNGVSRSSSTSRVSNSKENVVNRDTSENLVMCTDDNDDDDDDDDEDECNQHQEVKLSHEKTASNSSDVWAMAADIQKRTAAIEEEHRKIHNKIIELHGEKITHELVRQGIAMGLGIPAKSDFMDPNSGKEMKLKKRKLSKLKSPSHYTKQPKDVSMEGRQNVTLNPGSPVTQLVSRHSRSSTSLKRDNVRKEQNSSFPARRHYEAEGRANEDPDITVLPTTAASPILDNTEIQEKISHKEEQTEEAVADNLEATAARKDKVEVKRALSQLNQLVQDQLMELFPTPDRKNDDPVRSSGEGAYTLKKNPSRNVAPENAQKMHSARTVPRQDNLQLTRQNIVTMECQNRSSNSNLHNRDCNSVKKDNINNLSGKMGKLSIQNSMNSSYPDVLTASNNNMDSMSTFSYELNQNHSLSNEVERKTIFDILKRDKKKQKQYDRNRDSKICCNSSVDSEPLEDPNCPLAFDSGTLGTWAWAEYIGDENEEHTQAESLEEQDDEEDSSVFEKEPLRRPRSVTQYSGQYSNMQQYIDSVANIHDKRQRNLHQSAYHRNQNQVPQNGYHQHSSQAVKSTRQRVPSNAASVSRDLHDNVVCTNATAEHYHQSPPTKFIQQLKNHIDQLNTLCHNQMYQDRPQSSDSPPSHMPNTCTPLQSTSEVLLPYNQQLLLCLSQCYHALYMQQLEIHHLQRCMWHNVDGENSHQQNHLNTRSNHEDSSFRPYCIPSWPNPFNPPSHLFPDQMSPLSSTACFHRYANHSNSSYATGSGTQPARAVIHPTSQNNVSAQETLNNQVPPRTRANNFWDNFRSYSRQNLLSTSNTTKRNENIASLVTPQVRQVYPLVTNSSPSRTTDATNTCCSSSSFSDYNRSASNPEDTATKNIKCNTPTIGAAGFLKKDVATNVTPRRNYRAAKLGPPSHATNVIHQQPLSQEGSKSASINAGASTYVAQSVPETTEAPTPAISAVLSSEQKSDFIIGLFHEASALKSEASRQKALRMIRDIAVSERLSDDVSQTKVQNAHGLSESEKESTSASNQQCPKSTVVEAEVLSSEITDHEKASYLPSDSTSGIIQNLPTAAIPPLSKHGTPRTVSTGAIRKIPRKFSTDALKTPSGLVSSHESTNSATDNCVNAIDPPISLSPNKIDEAIPAFVTDKVIADLAAMLPSLKRRLLRDGCSQTFWTFINDCLLESLRAHMFFCNINLSRKSLLHVRQTIYLFLSLFSGMTLTDIDSELIKYVEEFIYENVSCYIANGQFAPVPSSMDEENCSLDLDNKMQDLYVKMSNEPVEPINIKLPVKIQAEPNEPVNIKMPSKLQDDGIETVMKVPLMSLDENISFPSQCGTVPQQNILSYESFIPDPVALGPGPAEPEHVEDLRCDCNPEAEIEPEVEIGTEADLAEADQSPGQQGSGVREFVPALENWPLDHDSVLLQRNIVGSILVISEDEIMDHANSSDGETGPVLPPETNVDQEAVLDDIPTKLCAYASEEELPQQSKDDQPVQLSSDDTVSQSEFGTDNFGDGVPTNLK